VHEKRRDHQCPQCPKAFSQAGHLTVHVRTVHEKLQDHACPQCGRPFGHASSMRRHVRTKHPAIAGGDTIKLLTTAASGMLLY